VEANRIGGERDQTSSDRDQTSSDQDQTTSDRDQTPATRTNEARTRFRPSPTQGTSWAQPMMRSMTARRERGHAQRAHGEKHRGSATPLRSLERSPQENVMQPQRLEMRRPTSATRLRVRATSRPTAAPTGRKSSCGLNATGSRRRTTASGQQMTVPKLELIATSQLANEPRSRMRLEKPTTSKGRT
jgi:hypothetical protein